MLRRNSGNYKSLLLWWAVLGNRSQPLVPVDDASHLRSRGNPIMSGNALKFAVTVGQSSRGVKGNIRRIPT